jgi:hypothetical protein
LQIHVSVAHGRASFGLLLLGRICFSVHLHLVIDGQLGLGSAAAEARASLKSKLE